ncbi:porin [Paraburkholderia megapolitana]|uniref:porin n=1 Tax=Paraburkholderia megapolitana TaxID=420953 RepID=UPI0038BB258D
MRRKIVCGALAAIGCFSNGAHAQGSVTLYGTIDTGFQYSNVGGQKTASLVTSSMHPTKWGLIGQEPLGGGTFAIFKLENGFNSVNGTVQQSGTIFGREAWVGLRNSSLGELRIGNNYTVPDITLRRDGVDFNWGTAANNFIFARMLRINNSIKYDSPELSGFSVQASYSLGSNGSTTLPRTLGNTATIGFRYATKNFAADADFATQVYSPANVINQGSTTSTGNYSFFIVRYDFGFLVAGASFEMHRGGTAAGGYSGYATVNNDFYEIAARVPINTFADLTFSFGQYKDLATSAGNATSYLVRYDYALSKRTTLYAGVAGIRNGSDASFSITSTVGPSVPVGVPGSNVTAGIVGMVHKF